jgi:hypothetical protein
MSTLQSLVTGGVLLASAWTDDAVQEIPSSPRGILRQVDGKQALLAAYGGLPASLGRMQFF